MFVRQKSVTPFTMSNSWAEQEIIGRAGGRNTTAHSQVKAEARNILVFICTRQAFQTIKVQHV